MTSRWALAGGSGSGRVFPSFPDPSLEDAGRAYYGENLERLLDGKRRYDPDGVFPPLA